MSKLLKGYVRIGYKRVVHRREDCHYYQRYFKAMHMKTTQLHAHDTKPHDCNVCDECQRLMSKAGVSQ